MPTTTGQPIIRHGIEKYTGYEAAATPAAITST